jgi:isopenicillin-N epimerase
MTALNYRPLFYFEEDMIYLNNGGYGATPRKVMQERFRLLEEIEADPSGYALSHQRPSWNKIAATIANRYALDPGGLAIVENTTNGMGAVLRAQKFEPGDEVLVTSLVYGAIDKAAAHLAALQGAKLVQASIPFSGVTPEKCIMAVRNAITPRTRLAILDHVTSATALVMPIVEMTAACHAQGIPVLVDGAHVPGNIPLDIASINPDWYVGSLHKWAFAPRACGFLLAHPNRRQGLLPTDLSWDMNEPYPACFSWTGTRDFSNWLGIPAAFAFSDELGSDKAIQTTNNRNLCDAIDLFADAWGVRTKTPKEMLSSMALIPLPKELIFPATDDGAKQLSEHLITHQKIRAAFTFADGERIWLRLSMHVYNTLEDCKRLAIAVNGLRTASPGL